MSGPQDLGNALDSHAYVGRFLLRVRPGGHFVLMRVLPDDTVVAGRYSLSLPGVNQVMTRADELTDRDIVEAIDRLEQDEEP